MKREKQVYPIILEKDGEFIFVDIPDLEISTQGEDMADAIEMARDAIGMLGIKFQDEKREIPQPSELDSIKIKKGQIKILVDMDFSDYRRRHDQRVVKKNCTIPSWIAYEAEKANINFSATLQEALKEKLNVKKVI